MSTEVVFLLSSVSIILRRVVVVLGVLSGFDSERPNLDVLLLSLLVLFKELEVGDQLVDF
jgi:hypothetical protein